MDILALWGHRRRSGPVRSTSRRRFSSRTRPPGTRRPLPSERRPVEGSSTACHPAMPKRRPRRSPPGIGPRSPGCSLGGRRGLRGRAWPYGRQWPRRGGRAHGALPRPGRCPGGLPPAPYRFGPGRAFFVAARHRELRPGRRGSGALAFRPRPSTRGRVHRRRRPAHRYARGAAGFRPRPGRGAAGGRAQCRHRRPD